MVTTRISIPVPDRHPVSVPLALPQQGWAGSYQQVLPQQGVRERLLVGAEQGEDAAGSDNDHQFPLGPANSDSQPAGVQQEPARSEQVARVALGRTDED